MQGEGCRMQGEWWRMQGYGGYWVILVERQQAAIVEW
jgi:hypothetical protein